MTQEDIEAEWWAYHYQDSKASVEFDDDDENASSDFLEQAKRDWEAMEAEMAANGGAPKDAEEPASHPADDPGDWGPSE